MKAGVRINLLYSCHQAALIIAELLDRGPENELVPFFLDHALALKVLLDPPPQASRPVKALPEHPGSETQCPFLCSHLLQPGSRPSQ